MTDKKFIPVVLGTGREGRRSEKAARYVAELLKERGDCEAELIDVRDHAYGQTIAPWMNDPKTKPWQDIAKRASAFILVFPEYNHGYPGELKLLLDQDYDNYKGKKVLLCGVSVGQFGGARGVENLLPVLRELSLVVLQPTLYFIKIEETFKKSKAELDKIYKENFNKAVNLF